MGVREYVRGLAGQLRLPFGRTLCLARLGNLAGGAESCVEGVVGAGRCACATRRPRQASAELGLEARAGEKAKKTECLEEEVDLAALDNALDWLTLFVPAPNADPPEPIAGGDAAQPGSSSGAAEPPYPAQAHMRRAFDDERMVGNQKAETKRQKRARRAQLRDAAFRIFTTDVSQAGSLRCQLDIKPWISGSLQFRSVSRFLFCM